MGTLYGGGPLRSRLRIAALITSCFAVATVEAQDNEVEARLLSHVLNYQSCIDTYAKSRTGSTSTPTEIANASIYHCARHLKTYRDEFGSLVKANFTGETQADDKARGFLEEKLAKDVADIERDGFSRALTEVVSNR